VLDWARQKEKFINRKTSPNPARKSMRLIGCPGIGAGFHADVNPSPPSQAGLLRG
jgi:hypothetical protein